MLELPAIIRAFDPSVMKPFIEAGQGCQRVLLTGEGSSRLFPAKHAIWRHQQTGQKPAVSTEGATQALEYPLADSLVVGASNSGRIWLIAMFAPGSLRERLPRYPISTSMAPGNSCWMRRLNCSE